MKENLLALVKWFVSDEQCYFHRTSTAINYNFAWTLNFSRTFSVSEVPSNFFRIFILIRRFSTIAGVDHNERESRERIRERQDDIRADSPVTIDPRLKDDLFPRGVYCQWMFVSGRPELFTLWHTRRPLSHNLLVIRYSTRVQRRKRDVRLR